MRSVSSPARSIVEGDVIGTEPGTVGPDSRVVLITGCSTGIGHATAERFAARGWTVYASARQVSALEDLAAEGCRVLSVDVTDEDSMRLAVSRVIDEAGRIDVLVNNAGYGLYGPLEEVPMTEIRRQFETNVFGLIRLSQLVLPAMRSQRRGTIVNVSSIGGRLVLPGGGPYHASKHAVEAVSDALRVEVAQFGIRVVVIEPGPVRTPWAEGAASSIAQSAAPLDGTDPYAAFKVGVDATLRSTSSGIAARAATSPEHVAQSIVRAAQARNPKSRYRPGLIAKLLLAVRWCCPDLVWDYLVTRRSPAAGSPT